MSPAVVRGRRGRERCRSFALVIALFLVVLLATTGAGLAMTTTAESFATGWAAHDLHHRLAVDSLLECLPEVLDRGRRAPSSALDSRTPPHITLAFADVRIECDIYSERGKLLLGSNQEGTSVERALHDRAREAHLPEENIKLRPIVDSHAAGGRLPRFVWFDQFVKATQVEEAFRRRFASQAAGSEEARKTWSDLVTFWSAANAVQTLEVETNVAGQRRRWYLVVEREGSLVRVLFRGGI